jgi:hypothetical protein
VADDKAVYAYMPALIKYYLGEEALLGQVPTYVGLRKDDFSYMREHLARAGGQDHRRLRRLQHADGPVRRQEGDRGVPGRR